MLMVLLLCSIFAKTALPANTLLTTNYIRFKYCHYVTVQSDLICACVIGCINHKTPRSTVCTRVYLPVL